MAGMFRSVLGCFAAWPSMHGSGGRRRPSAEFVGHMLRREGWGCPREGLGGGGGGWGGGLPEAGGPRERRRRPPGEGRGRRGPAREEQVGRALLRIKVAAEVDGVRGDYTMTYGRYGKDNAAVGRAYIREEANAERFAAVIKALTGEEPWVYRKSNGTIVVECGREHLEGFMRYTELADAIARWLDETGRR